MPALQKHAILNLVVVTAAVLLFLALLPLRGPQPASAGFSLLALLAIAGVFYRKRRREDGQTEPVYDERDRQIQQRANLISMGVLWLAFVGSCNWAWWVSGDAGKISTTTLVLAVWLATALWQGVWAIAVLWQYRRQG